MQNRLPIYNLLKADHYSIVKKMDDQSTFEPARHIDAIKTVKPFVRKKKTWPAKLAGKIRIAVLVFYHKFILGSKRWRTVTRNGIKYRLQCEHIGKRVIKYGGFQKEKIDFFIECAHLLQPEAHIDCGAHVGTHLLPLIVAGLAKKYYAIEAGKLAFDALQKNLELNGFVGQVGLFNNALSDSEKEVVFSCHTTIANAGHGIEDDVSTQAHSFNDNTEIVQSTLLDSLVNFENSRISIKIDVEGHELAVLKGAQKLLAGNQVLLQIECWDHNAAHLNWLFANGFYLIAAIGDDYYLRNFEPVQP